MLCYDIRSLDREAVHVDGCLGADDEIWEQHDVRPLDCVHATGRLSSAGSGRVYWSGRIDGAAELSCRRCLTPVIADAADDVHIVFADADDDEVDDPDVYRIPERAHGLDLRPAVREQWLLSVPSYALCRRDCRGLCPRCGTDQNAGVCDCASVATDSRFDALRRLRSESE